MWKAILSIFVFTTIIGSVGGYIYSLKSKITDLSHNLELQKSENSSLTLEVAVKDKNIEDLNKSIAIANEAYEKIKANNDKAVKDLLDYKNKPLEERISNKELQDLLKGNKYNKNECVYGLELNRVISKLKYEEL